jgi:hypothetical protein
MNLLELAGELIDAFNTFDSASRDLEYIRSIAQEFAEHGTVQNPHDVRYQPIIDAFEESAKEVTSAPLPTAFDAARYAVSADELASCATRDAALAKIQRYLDELQAAQSRGVEARALLDAKIAGADAAARCVDETLELYAKLSVLPDFGTTFAWNWLDLDQVVRPAIMRWRSALGKQREAVERELGKLALYIPNLTANLAALRQLRCSIDGTWRGSFTLAGQTMGGVRVDFARAGSGYVGAVSATVDGDTENATLSDIRLDASRNIHFAIEDFDAVCDGVVAGDFRRMSGTLREMDEGNTGTFSLQFG